MNSLALTLGAYLLFVTSCGVIFLCGDPHDSGVLGRCNRMFAITIPKVAKQGIQKIPVLGPRLVYAADNGYDYVCFRPNPLLQLLYVVLVLGGYAIFLLQCLPHMPNAFMAPYHNYTTHIAVFITMCTFILASRKSPGYVNKKSVSLYLKSYEYDNFLYVPQDCTTCEVQKPARSKHCPICKTCVATFDHHCPWINTCVGERNKRYFISFLVSTALLLSYATFVVTGVILHHIDRHKLLTQTFVNRKTGEKVEASFGIIAQFIMSRYGWMVMLFVLCAIMGVVLWGFLFYHLYLVARGKTTNEVAKWDSVQGFYANSLKEYRESHKASGKPPIKQVPAKTPLATRPPEEYPDSIPDNTYNFGIRTNFYDMMFPRCERNFESLVQTSVEESDDQPDTKNDVKSKKQTGSLRRRKNK